MADRERPCPADVCLGFTWETSSSHPFTGQWRSLDERHSVFEADHGVYRMHRPWHDQKPPLEASLSYMPKNQPMVVLGRIVASGWDDMATQIRLIAQKHHNLLMERRERRRRMGGAEVVQALRGFVRSD